MGYDAFCMQARNINDELQALFAALPDAIHRAAIALQTEPSPQPQPADNEEEVDTLMKRIHQLIDAQERAAAG
jgi:hypothetical protein